MLEPLGILRLAAGVIVGFTPRFLGGGEDRDFLLLAAFGVAFGGIALLLDQGALPRGLFSGGKRSAGPGRRGRGSGGRRRCAGAARGDRDTARRRRGRARASRAGSPWGGGALLADLDLNVFRSSVTEGLPHRAGIDRPSQFQPCRRSERKSALARFLIVAF